MGYRPLEAPRALLPLPSSARPRTTTISAPRTSSRATCPCRNEIPRMALPHPKDRLPAPAPSRGPPCFRRERLAPCPSNRRPRHRPCPRHTRRAAPPRGCRRPGSRPCLARTAPLRRKALRSDLACLPREASCRAARPSPASHRRSPATHLPVRFSEARAPHPVRLVSRAPLERRWRTRCRSAPRTCRP